MELSGVALLPKIVLWLWGNVVYSEWLQMVLPMCSGPIWLLRSLMLPWLWSIRFFPKGIDCMSEEWINDENWDSVIVWKEGRKKIGERKRTSICDTCMSPVFSGRALVLTSLRPTLPLVIYCLSWVTHCARCCGKIRPPNVQETRV